MSDIIQRIQDAYARNPAEAINLLPELMDVFGEWENENQQINTENNQLKEIILQIDPDFFTRKCRVCGCNWNHACTEGCYWVEEDLCSSCASQKGETEEYYDEN